MTHTCYSESSEFPDDHPLQEEYQPEVLLTAGDGVCHDPWVAESSERRKAAEKLTKCRE